jgi:hypothetical protein
MQRPRQVLLFLLVLFVADLFVLWLARSDLDIAKDPKIVFMVISKHSNYNRRMSIRESWKKRVDENHKASHVLFFLAQNDTQSNAKLLARELNSYNDIVMLNMTENYALLKYKVN